MNNCRRSFHTLCEICLVDLFFGNGWESFPSQHLDPDNLRRSFSRVSLVHRMFGAEIQYSLQLVLRTYHKELYLKRLKTWKTIYRRIKTISLLYCCTLSSKILTLFQATKFCKLWISLLCWRCTFVHRSMVVWWYPQVSSKMKIR